MTSTREAITLRPAVAATDFPRIAELLTAVETQPVTAAELQEWEARHPPGQVRCRSVAVNEEGEIVGYSIVLHEPWEEDGRFYLWVATEPAWQGRGVGAHLYDRALAFAREQGATFLSSQVREQDGAAVAFARRRGFIIDRHLFESTIDLKTFEEERFASLIERVESMGIRLFSLADAGDSEAARRKLHALNYATYLDDPGSTGSFPDFDTFNEMFNTATWFRPEGQLLAADGERYVGLSAVGYFATSNSMYNMMTGVDREYRGRGLAQALKLLTIRFARQYGADYIRTNNDSQNKAMLAINRKLGYRPQPGLYRLTQAL